MKTMSHSLRAQRLELGDHLRRCLDPRAAAERDDDVAELALERAAARELEAAEQVVPHLEQVESRHRHLRHVGLLGLLVARLVPSLLATRVRNRGQVSSASPTKMTSARSPK